MGFPDIEVRQTESAGEAIACVVATQPNRWVILHYHIFKNAGSTIEHVLQREFGRGFATLHGPAPDSVVRHDALLSFLSGHPELTAVSSHHLNYPKPALAGWVFFDVCFFRDPLPRLWSLYQYLRRVESTDELNAGARSLDAGGFFDLLMEEHPHMVNDVQVNTIANGGVYTRPPNVADLRLAVDVLNQVSVLGVVELFDQSLVAAEYYLRPAFPSLQFQYLRQNASVTISPNDGAGGEEQFRAAIGETRWERLELLNRLDRQLVARARREILRRFAMIPRSEERLADFRARCEKLRRASPGITAGASSAG